MLAALAHDFGKPATTEFIEGRLRSRGHEAAGVPPTESFLSRLNVHTIDGYDVRNQVISLVREHLKPGEFYKKRDEVGEGAFRRLARRCELDLLYGLFSERVSWTLNSVRRNRCCWVVICSR
jgi:tRNA nucleotidyltransferase (CCA-adding enzyme)